MKSNEMLHNWGRGFLNRTQAGPVVLQPSMRSVGNGKLEADGTLEKRGACETKVGDTEIVLQDVWKSYSNGTDALRGLTFSFSRGQIFCLVGPNGSGKSTSLRILGTQLMPTSGKVNIFGLDAVKDPTSVRHHLAVIPQDAQPTFELTPFEQVYYCLRSRGESRRDARAGTETALENLGLAKVKSVLTAKLSGGYRRRVLIALAIATKAQVLLLDEPTTGLDPAARRQVWDDLIRLKANHAVLLTTHSMEESEALADFVGVMHQGRMAAYGSVSQLRRQLPIQFKVRFEDGLCPDLFWKFGSLEKYGGKHVLYPSNQDVIDEIVRFALREHVPVSVLPTDLEDVYFYVTRGDR